MNESLACAYSSFTPPISGARKYAIKSSINHSFLVCPNWEAMTTTFGTNQGIKLWREASLISFQKKKLCLIRGFLV